jgi:hypothetical protein
VPELLAAAEKYDIGELKEHCIKVSVVHPYPELL